MQNAEWTMPPQFRRSLVCATLSHQGFRTTHYPLSTTHLKGGAAAVAGTHQGAISIIPVSGTVVLGEAVEWVVGIRVRAVAQQVAGTVVLPADDLYKRGSGE
jgi:hypothetical protein